MTALASTVCNETSQLFLTVFLFLAEDEDIICPLCNCLTPRKPFVVDNEDDSGKEETIESRFADSKARLALLEKKPAVEFQLALYGLYKQVELGDCNTQRPGAMDLAGRKKWDAWNSRKGMTKEQAMAEYIAVVDKLTQ